MLMDATNSALAQIDAAFQQSNGVTTDTRHASPGKLFFALKGDRFNGNEFALQALEAGCTLAVVDDATVSQQSERCIEVKDVLIALQSLAYLHRSRWNFPVIGLTGSNGKTTTKELLYAVLKTAFTHTYATRGNLNNHIGVPLTILEIPVEADMAIIEMGANAQGEIAELARIAQPTHGVIINIGEAHLEGFGGIKGVIKGKQELFRYFEHPGSRGERVFVHANHPILLEISTALERTCYGNPAHPPFIQTTASNDRAVTWIDVDGSMQGPLNPYITGHHNHDNMMTAVAIGRHFGVSAAQCSQAIEGYNPNNNRSQWRQTERNLVLMDAYNANPSSMSTTLEHFAHTEESGKEPSVCILGDMAELGDFGREAHERILGLAVGLGLDVWTVGPLFQHAASNQSGPIKSFDNTESAAAALKLAAWSDRRVLLKGSRSIALEQLVDLL
jgi:UDP-N-acetylmuramoyl-tripeptide--D-alanyl-D-alanine ligase